MGRTRQLFRCEGDYWTIAFAGRLIRLRDRKGLRYLSVLLVRPGRWVESEELVALAASDHAGLTENRPRHAVARRRSAGRDRTAERARLTVTKGIKSAIDRIAVVHPRLGEHLSVTIRRGFACSYMVDPHSTVPWQT